MTKRTCIYDIVKTCNQSNMVLIAFLTCIQGHTKELVLEIAVGFLSCFMKFLMHRKYASFKIGQLRFFFFKRQ